MDFIGGPGCRPGHSRDGRRVDGQPSGDGAGHHDGGRPAGHGPVLARASSRPSCRTAPARTRSACSWRPSSWRCSSMRGVQVGDDPLWSRGSRCWSSFMLVVVDIVVLVNYIHHIGRSLRVSALIELVGENTRTLLDKTYPAPGGAEQDQRSEDPRLVHADKLRCAEPDRSRAPGGPGHRGRLHDRGSIPALGQFVPAGSPLVRLRGASASDVDLARLRGRAAAQHGTHAGAGRRLRPADARRHGDQGSLREPVPQIRPRPSRSSTGSTT